MRFSIEQRHLTDPSGRPVADPRAAAFYSLEAETSDEAVRLFVSEHEAELIGNVLHFPGFQAIATMRNPTGVFTLQISPTSQRMSTLA